MNWNTFKNEAKKFRIEHTCRYRYISTLLLGIAEEIKEYKEAVAECKSIETQEVEYGHILWNIAELSNVLEEINTPFLSCGDTAVYAAHLSMNGCQVSKTCVQAVRKHYLKRLQQDKLLHKACAVLTMCEVMYTTTPIACNAMIAGIEDMEQRGRINENCN